MNNKVFKALPQDLAAERVVLAAIIKSNDTIGEIIDIIAPKDFYITSHMVLYTNMLEMFNKDIPVEVESICNVLGTDKLQSIGGVTYIAELISTELTENVCYYAESIKEKSERREIILSCKEAIEAAYGNDKKPENIIDDVETSFLGLNESNKEKTNTIGEVMEATLDDIERKYNIEGDIPGVSTGLISLDKATNGYQKGDLWIIAARPSMGKTLLNLNLLSNFPQKNNAIMFELEMTKEKLGNRILASHSKVHSKILARGKLNGEEFNRVATSCGEITAKNNTFINCKSGIGLGYIRSEAKKIKLKYGLDVIFIDHLGLMKTSKKNNRNLEIGELTAGLKAIAKDLDVCIVTLSQLSRACEQRSDKHPILSDLRDSGNLEQDADTVMLLYRDDYYAERENRESKNIDTLEVFIAKNRDGEVGGIEFYCDLENQFIGEKNFTH